MSNARKCDRCGKCFDPLRFGDKTVMARFQNPIFQNSEQIKDHDIGYYLTEDTADSYVDLCPDCTRDFEAFMEGSPLALHENDYDQPDTDIPERISNGDLKKDWFQTFWDEVNAKIERFGLTRDKHCL